MSTAPERLVGQLTRIRELSGLSLRALARQTGLSSSSLSRYMTGQLVPPWEAVVALCRAVSRDPRPLRPLWTEAMQAGAAPAPRRNDLPADIADFTGREAEAARVAELLRSAGAVVVDGMGGVGKTSLAVHVAHRLAPSYPDGGLYLDLLGFTPGQEPLEPSVALGRLLGALGVEHPPASTAERAALWRSELSRKQALVVLDNAAEAEQVRQLLPGAGKSAVLVTSRNRFVDLDGVPPVSLEPLSPAEAAELFGRAAGVSLGDEDGASRVLDQCGGLPLALRMAGARLRHRPGWTIAILAERLGGDTSRFDAVFGMSLRQLDSEQRRMFRLLGVLPGADFDAAAAVALTGMREGTVHSVLEELVDAHLAQESPPGRYRLHDLIRRYAADLAAEEEPQTEAAVRRVLDHYLTLAVAHDRTLPWGRADRVPGDPAQAVAWFDTEYPNLIACFDAAVRLGADEVVAGLPPAMRAWFFRRRGTDDQVRMLEAGAAAAGRLGRDQERAALLADLGFAHAAAGRLTDALRAYELAARADPAADAELAGGLALRTGFALRDLGEFTQAQAQFRRAEELFGQTGNRGGQSQALAFDGWVTLHLGEPQEAATIARQAVALAAGPARITGLVTLGVALAGEDEAESRKLFAEALELAELAHNQAWCHNYFGVALRVMGALDEALVHHRRALELIEQLAEAQLEINFLHTYAETCRAAGLTCEALALLDRTIDLARKLGRPNDERLAAEARTALLAG
ncbi:ATP-binding protein [Longispora albida]|uniref:ATP-binding protein n=1 Tax=Longispora albida TaxID=203523 RepID=UPI001FE1DF37|nr:helix-turn-helix domain-containing protein [Longispora albida]